MIILFMHVKRRTHMIIAKAEDVHRKLDVDVFSRALSYFLSLFTECDGEVLSLHSLFLITFFSIVDFGMVGGYLLETPGST